MAMRMLIQVAERTDITFIDLQTILTVNESVVFISVATNTVLFLLSSPFLETVTR